MIGLSEKEKLLLKLLQEGINLEIRPFKTLGEKLDLSEKEILSLIQKLKEEKIIRQISPIYDTKSLGYDTALVAFKVKGNIESVAEIINSHPGVSHNYERNNSFNLWFTIAVPPDSRLGLERTVSLLAKITNSNDFVILKTVKLYKIGVKLDFNNLKEKEVIRKNEDEQNNIVLTEDDKKIIKITQDDIPMVEEPFRIYADKLGMEQEDLLKKLTSYKEKGIMRRFSAILYHRKAGFKANGMTVWKVPEDRSDEVGYKLASYRSITHCYKRTTNEKWQYNIFSMIHSKSKDELDQFVRELSQEIGINDYMILYSTKEFKKKRIRYFSDEFYKWEDIALRK
ncbi:MAG: Lrp/AsnC family transcriptional regulator [Persephonella sp.]|nr:MAG: Lrp/AsnC family transcriptional regulator [Persephonella sp.]RUM61081.1 MAG: Lrp/AsnC family transcriptional regulator [Persephonella sp.]